MDALRDLIVHGNEAVALDVAALELATMEFPGIPLEFYTRLLDSYAAEMKSRLSSTSGGREFISAMSYFLFVELGFQGNVTDYYNPRNSCLNEVLTRRLGIPITLSVVYMEISRRLGRPVSGIGLPGHFVVHYDDGVLSSYIDVFRGGEILTADGCLELSQKTTGAAVDPSVLKPASKRQILLRMLNNLRTVYLQRRAYRKAIDVFDLLIEAQPHSAVDYKQRAILQLELQQFQKAQADLERYLVLEPSAPDREEVNEQLDAIRHWRAALN